MLLFALFGCEDESRSRTEPSPAPPEYRAADPRPVILFLGTSLTAGHGLPSSQAFPALIQERVDAAGLDYRVVNAGVSGDTSAGGLRRLDWLLRLPISMMVLELGGNDMLRGLDVDSLRENLTAIIRRMRDRHPDVRIVIAGMRAPHNLGREYVAAFESVYPSLARENDADLVPFLLEGVAGEASLNLRDGIHPNVDGHREIAQTVWAVVEPAIRK